MKEQLKDVLQKAKEFWDQQSDKRKKLFMVAGAGVLLAAVVITVVLNVKKNEYKVLYPKLSSSETAQVSAALQEMAVPARVNADGEIMVPAEQWDALVFELAGKGYPKSAPPYGIFLENTGLTKTEFEKRQILQMQLQDRLQDTLARIEGIQSAVVTIDTRQKSEYVWEQDTDASSASVLVSTENGYELSPERVSAIKNLLAYSVSGMLPENVKVIDAATGVEMDDMTTTPGDGIYDLKRLDYEKRIQKHIENNILRLLTPKYGPRGVTAVAKVTLDYDKMMTESRELVPQNDGNGVKTHFDEKYILSGEVPAQGIVGEENNTDTPVYANQQGDGTGDVTQYQRSVDYDISYILTQIEKGQAILKKASVSVVVNDPDFDAQRQEVLTDLISKSVDIDPSYISVTNLDYTDTQSVAADAQGDFIRDNLVLIAIIAGALLLLLILLIILAVRRGKNKNDNALPPELDDLPLMDGEDVDGLGELSEEAMNDIKAEIAERKRELQERADAGNKALAITNEVREFARENPDITAMLIRSMLKEDE